MTGPISTLYGERGGSSSQDWVVTKKQKVVNNCDHNMNAATWSDLSEHFTSSRLPREALTITQDPDHPL